MKDKKKQFVISQKEVEWRIVNKGLPQGGVLSPILYATYTNKIHQGVEYRCQVLQYVDDIVVYSSGMNKIKSVKDIEVAVKRIDKNLRSIGLKLQPEKMQMDFNRMGDIDERVKIKLQDHRIREEEKRR